MGGRAVPPTPRRREGFTPSRTLRWDIFAKVKLKVKKQLTVFVNLLFYLKYLQIARVQSEA